MSPRPVAWAPIPDPETGTWLCPCTVLYPDQLGAVKCAQRHRAAAVPVIPGATSMKRPEPWKPVVYESRAADRRRMRRLGLIIALCAASYLLGIVVFAASGHLAPPPRPGAVTPSVTPPPCPAGGVSCYREAHS